MTNPDPSWIPHDGGERPSELGLVDRVEVRGRLGQLAIDCVYDMRWHRVVAYRMTPLPNTWPMRDTLVSAIRRSVVVQGTNGVVMGAEAAADSLIAEGWVAAPDLAEALKATVAQLDKAADQFAFYADEHAKKDTKEGETKGAVNHQWALACAKSANVGRAALAKLEPDDAK